MSDTRYTYIAVYTFVVGGRSGWSVGRCEVTRPSPINTPTEWYELEADINKDLKSHYGDVTSVVTNIIRLPI